MPSRKQENDSVVAGVVVQLKGTDLLDVCDDVGRSLVTFGARDPGGLAARAVPARGPAIAIAATIDDSAAAAAAFRGRATCIGVFPPCKTKGGFVRLGQVTVKGTWAARLSDMTELVTTEANLIRS